jgi:hypothetical protein
MDTQITLGDASFILSARLSGGGERRFLYLSFCPVNPEASSEFLICLSRIEALTLWNFLDEALEIPLNSPGK